MYTVHNLVAQFSIVPKTVSYIIPKYCSNLNLIDKTEKSNVYLIIYFICLVPINLSIISIVKVIIHIAMVIIKL